MLDLNNQIPIFFSPFFLMNDLKHIHDKGVYIHQVSQHLYVFPIFRVYQDVIQVGAHRGENPLFWALKYD